MKGRPAPDAPPRANTRRKPSPGVRKQGVSAASADDVSLRPLARALLALAQELLEREGNKG